MKKLVTLLLPVCIFLSCAFNRYAVRFEPRSATRLPAEVLDVIDGDTVLVRTLNPSKGGTNVIHPFQTNSLRMLFIDTPESSGNVKLERNLLQYFARQLYVKKEDVIALGKEATLHLSGLLHPGDRIELEFPSNEVFDKYGRLLALVFINGTNANYRMVRDGYAMTYFLGSSSSPALRFYRRSFLTAEETAQRQGLGIWKTLK